MFCFRGPFAAQFNHQVPFTTSLRAQAKCRNSQQTRHMMLRCNRKLIALQCLCVCICIHIYIYTHVDVFYPHMYVYTYMCIFELMYTYTPDQEHISKHFFLILQPPKAAQEAKGFATAIGACEAGSPPSLAPRMLADLGSFPELCLLRGSWVVVTTCI